MGQNIGATFEKTLDNHAKNIGNPLENHEKKHWKPNGKPWEKKT